MSEPTAQASITVDAPPQKVWRVLTDPDQIREYYMGATISTDWQVGSPITFTGEWNGQSYQDKGEILAVETGKLLSYSHWSPMTGTDDAPENYHVVEIALEDMGDRTNVGLAQSNLTGGVTDADRKSRADYEKNWSTMLEGLKRVAERS